jgi:2'-5' RNA ligase
VSQRLFVALPFPEARFNEVEALFQGVAGRFKWVAQSNLHVTLKFLGAVEDDQAAAVRSALREAFRGAAAFRVEWKGLGAFPSPRRPEVIWIGASAGREAVEDLAQRAEAALAGAGFARETRPFHAHLTLARAKDRAPAGPLWTAEWETREFGAAEVRAAALMRSHLKPGGPVYETVDVYPLEGT